MSNCVLASIPQQPTIINKNAVINGYFLDPVNQLGQNKYFLQGSNINLTTVDNWCLSTIGESASLTLSTEGVNFAIEEVTSGASNPFANFHQNIPKEYFDHYPNMKYFTISLYGIVNNLVLGANNVWFNKLITLESKMFSTFTFSTKNLNLSNGLDLVFQINKTTDVCKPIALKLEPGTEQSLIKYKNNNYELELASIPDKEEELRRCQSSLYVIAGKNYEAGNDSIFGTFLCWNDGGAQCIIPVPVSFSVNKPQIYFKNIRFINTGVEGSAETAPRCQIGVEKSIYSETIGDRFISSNNIIVNIIHKDFKQGMHGWIDFLNLDGYFIISRYNV